MTEELIAFCCGVDVLLIDAAFSWDNDGIFHLSSGEAGQVAAAAGVKTLILTHFYPLQQRVKYNPKKEAAKYFKGKIIVAKDLMKLKI